VGAERGGRQYALLYSGYGDYVNGDSENGFRLFAALLLVCLFSAGCCEDPVPRVYRTAYDFRFPLDVIELSGEPAAEVDRRPGTGGTRFRTRLFEGRVAGEDYGFNIGLTPRVTDPITILWTEATYVDESRREHSLISYSGGGLPRPDDPVEDVLLSGRETVFSVSVAEKVRKLRTSCSNWVAHHEPVIPWIHEATPPLTRERVQALATQGHLLEYRVPLAYQNEKRMLNIVFRLERQNPDSDWTPMIY